jgi:adenylate cyclase
MLLGLRQPSVEAEPFRDEYGLTLSGYAPIRDDAGAPVALLGVDLDAARVERIKRSVLGLTLLVFGGAALGLLGVGWLVGRRVRRPVARLIEAAHRVEGGDYAVRVTVPRQDEFRHLGESFNHMAVRLAERTIIRETFGRYVSEAVAQRLLSQPDALRLGGVLREVTVLVSDLRGYSTVSEQLAPAQVVALLNVYLGAMNEIIDQHEGCVIEYLGDGILAVFGAPNDLPDHAAQALRCALAMRQRLEGLNTTWEETEIGPLLRAAQVFPLQARVGLHSGSVVAGNLGSATRMKFAVTGDTVNVASRLEQLNRELETSVLHSAAVQERLPPELAALAVARGARQLRGRSQPVEVFSV